MQSEVQRIDSVTIAVYRCLGHFLFPSVSVGGLVAIYQSSGFSSYNLMRSATEVHVVPVPTVRTKRCGRAIKYSYQNKWQVGLSHMMTVVSCVSCVSCVNSDSDTGARQGVSTSSNRGTCFPAPDVSVIPIA